MEIEGSSVLVTGAAGGLGEAIARELDRRGAELVLSGRNEERLTALADELVSATVVVADLTDDSDVARLCERAADVDALVLNAGVGDGSVLRDLDLGEIDAVIDTNLRAPVKLALGFAQDHLVERRAAAIVLIGSLAGLSPTPNTRLYNATKFGLRGFALSLAQELDGTGITVTHVAPGFIRDAGMFATSGIDLPPGVRTRPPQAVADAVVKAIETGPMELLVAPTEMRLGATLSTVFPSLTAAVMRWAGAADRTASRTL